MRPRFATLVFLLGAAFFSSTLCVSSASAQSSNPAAAQALYDEARRLVNAGKYAEACPKFKESYELEPGGGTLLNLADCYDKLGKTSLAWTTFKEALVAAQRSGRTDRIDYANQRIAAVEGRLAHLTVNVGGAARVPGLSVTVDGSSLGEAAWGVAMPIDPGTHLVRAEAPGKKPFEASVEVTSAAAVQKSVDVAALEDGATGPKPAAASQKEVPEGGSTGGGDPRATVGIIVGAVGVASLGLGTYFGLTAFAKWNDHDKDCAGGCSTTAARAGTDANQAATIADVGFGVGVAALAVGTYLVLSGHSAQSAEAREPVALRVTPAPINHGAAVSVEGAW
jgi:hypothetical protein